MDSCPANAILVVEACNYEGCNTEQWSQLWSEKYKGRLGAYRPFTPEGAAVCKSTVWRHEEGKAYIFKLPNGKWCVGPNYNKRGSGWRAQSPGDQPLDSAQKWEVYTNTWIQQSVIKVSAVLAIGDENESLQEDIVRVRQMAAAKQSTSAAQSSLCKERVPLGEYWVYHPQCEDQHTQVLVVAHGSVEPGASPDVNATARRFCDSWRDFGDANNQIIVAPLFDLLNFATGTSGSAYGGYRALLGRVGGADEFVISIAEKLGHERFHLYGHSAGAQFGNRFGVRHPSRLLSLVLSAPGRFAFPNPAGNWPYGSRRINIRIKWENPNQIVPLEVNPDPEGWENLVNGVPIHIVVGAQDTAPQPGGRGYPANSTRIAVGQLWAGQMNELAAPGKPAIVVEVVPSVKHDSRRLTPHAQRFFKQAISSLREQSVRDSRRQVLY